MVQMMRLRQAGKPRGVTATAGHGLSPDVGPSFMYLRVAGSLCGMNGSLGSADINYQCRAVSLSNSDGLK